MALIAFCTPLMDLLSHVNEEFLLKYHLDADSSILAGPDHENLYQDLIQQFPVTYFAGGSGQNTMRVAQALLPPGDTTYVGSIGRDSFGSLLTQISQTDGLNPLYWIHPTLPTGTCTVLITSNGKHRCLIASLSAAQYFSLEHALSLPVKEKLQSSRIVYITGYFLQVSLETINYVFNFSQRNDKITCFNLSAVYVCEGYNEKILEVLPYVDYLFGNEAEAMVLAKVTPIHFGTINQSLEEIIQKLANWEKRGGTLRPRVVMITRGALPTIVAVSGKGIYRVPVDTVTPDEIVDTTGAGDAFVGGFLSELVKDKSLLECVKKGHEMAGRIIREIGVKITKDMKENK